MNSENNRHLSRRQVLRLGICLGGLISIPDILPAGWNIDRSFSDDPGNEMMPNGLPYPSPAFEDLTVSTCGTYHADGDRFTLRGQVRDAGGKPLPNVRVFLFQAAANGSHRHPGFMSEKEDPGFRYQGICMTNQGGNFEFLTVMPRPLAPLEVRGFLRCSKQGYEPEVLSVYRSERYGERRQAVCRQDLILRKC